MYVTFEYGILGSIMLRERKFNFVSVNDTYIPEKFVLINSIYAQEGAKIVQEVLYVHWLIPNN